jgi:hypothetical protein
MWRSGSSSYRLTSAATLVAFSLSCTTWKSPRLAPEQVIASNRPDHVRVLQPSGAQLELWHPRISNDSLVGRLAPADSTRLGGLPLADIKHLQVRGVSAGKTVLLIAGAGVAVLLVGAAVSDQDYFNGGSTDTTSCPLVYSWDGRQWRLDSGTFGGAIMSGLTRTDVDNLLHAATVGDTLRLRVANQARETDHLDYLTVLAVDHPPGSGVVPDGEGRLHSVVAPEAPAGAVDFRGRDVLARVSRSDGWAWESIPTDRDSSRAADIRDGIELSFRRPPDATSARLLVDASNSAWAQFMMKRFVALHGTATQAWYDSVAADPRLAQRIGGMMAREVYLSVAVKVGGRWERQGLVREGGPEISKQQIAPLDLSRVTGDTVTVRLESAPSLWLLDRVAIDYSAPGSFTSREILPSRAIDHHGRDVRGLIGAADEREYVMERGDRAELTFAVPPVQAGQARSYVLVTRGWYRIDVPATGEPQFALLERALAEPLAGSRLITGDLGRAIAALNQE